jgi:hydrogenase-4 component F
MGDMGGLTESHPLLGWSLLAGVAAITGLPPFGVFTSEFLVVSSTFAQQKILAVLVVLGLLLALGALLRWISAVSFGPIRGPIPPVRASSIPIYAHLALVLMAGMFLPGPLVRWFQHVAVLLG